MSTKTMRPPPRRAPWPNATATANNNNSTGFISNTSKNNHLDNSNNNNSKRKEERNDVGFPRPKKPQAASPAPSPSPSPSPMTRLPKYDKLMRAGSDPKKVVNNTNHNYNNNKDMKKRKKEEEEELGSKRKSQLAAGYLAHEYLTKGTLLGRRWDQVPTERVDPQHEDKYERYVQLAGLLKTDGAHFPGVVNPTQLARHLRLF